MEVGFTGHRPNKLWGYDLNRKEYVKLKQHLIDFFITEKVTKVYCGMALGFDTVVALATLECKEMGYDIELIACIPCDQQEKLWNISDQSLYRDIILKTDKIYGVSENGSEVQLVHMLLEGNVYELYDLDVNLYTVEYAPWRMMARNKIIVNHCDTLIALWDGTKGGTANCVNYAKQTGRVNIVRWSPAQFE